MDVHEERMGEERNCIETMLSSALSATSRTRHSW